MVTQVDLEALQKLEALRAEDFGWTLGSLEATLFAGSLVCWTHPDHPYLAAHGITISEIVDKLLTRKETIQFTWKEQDTTSRPQSPFPNAILRSITILDSCEKWHFSSADRDHAEEVIWINEKQ